MVQSLFFCPSIRLAQSDLGGVEGKTEVKQWERVT